MTNPYMPTTTPNPYMPTTTSYPPTTTTDPAMTGTTDPMMPGTTDPGGMSVDPTTGMPAPSADSLGMMAGEGGDNYAQFSAMMSDYENANMELQHMNFEFKKLEGVIGLMNRISQAKIG